MRGRRPRLDSGPGREVLHADLAGGVRKNNSTTYTDDPYIMARL
jgi:hypothetical protein